LTKQQSLCRTDRSARRDDFSLTRDLEIAQAVQESLLPQGNLNSAGLLYETYYRPLHNVGGDYYDFVPLDRNKIGIAIGDASGKGVGAALTMATLQASLRARVLQPGTGPLALVRSLNRLLYESSLEQVFASLFYAEYDPNSQCLTYVNAGHNPPLVLRTEGDSAGILRLESEGIPVGIFPDSTYREV
jgi:sigma-B regulation protein RsbU (phosphoserine phosphatase)